MLRATAAPERFLDGGGFGRFVASRGAKKAARTDLGIVVPPELRRFLDALGKGSLAGFRGRPELPSFGALVAAARRANGTRAFVRLTALLAGAVPFGETARGEIVAMFLEEAPARDLVVALGGRPSRIGSRLVCRGPAELAVLTAIEAAGEGAEVEACVFGIAEEEAVHVLVERGRQRALALCGSDARLRSAARALAVRPLDVPPPESVLTVRPSSRSRSRAASNAKAAHRDGPLALGPIVEAFFREDGDDLAPRLEAHARSADEIVADAARLFQEPRSPLGRDLARRRRLALRAARARAAIDAGREGAARMEMTERIVAYFDALPPNAESYAAQHERQETLLALGDLGHPDIAPGLLARAVTGDAAAVDMLGALGDRCLVPLVAPVGVPGALEAGLLRGEPSRIRAFEAAVVRMIVRVGAKEEACPTLRALLAENPLTNWRAGLERGALVRELVVALGKLGDVDAAPLLVSILDSVSQEYRTILPDAAQALGLLGHLPALTSLEHLLLSPKDPISSEAVWAVGALGAAHPDASPRAAALLERLKGLEPAAEAVRLTALVKVCGQAGGPPLPAIRSAIDRALWEPGYRQDDTSRRRAWALASLEELASLAHDDEGVLFLGHETVRHFVTRDDHRVRSAAERAFAAWTLPVPTTRRYYAFILPEIEERDGVDGLIEAVRDPLGVFRHNVATRLAAIGDERAVRPLAEATARLFAEPPTSTYEYDDAPPPLVAFVRALARLNRPEGNDVLIEGLRSDNHQIRAVVAEHAPDDPRFVPELRAMLGDSRSFLRSRAEKSLAALGAIPAPSIEPTTNEVPLARRLEG